MDNRADIDINPGKELEVDGTDSNNDGCIDGFDLNDDGDMDDWIMINETIQIYRGSLTDDEVRDYAASIQRGTKVFIINSCFGGGFVDDLSSDDTIIITGSREVCSASASVMPKKLLEAFGEQAGEADADGNGRVMKPDQQRYRNLPRSAWTGQFRPTSWRRAHTKHTLRGAPAHVAHADAVADLIRRVVRIRNPKCRVVGLTVVAAFVKLSPCMGRPRQRAQRPVAYASTWRVKYCTLGRGLLRRRLARGLAPPPQFTATPILPPGADRRAHRAFVTPGLIGTVLSVRPIPMTAGFLPADDDTVATPLLCAMLRLVVIGLTELRLRTAGRRGRPFHNGSSQDDANAYPILLRLTRVVRCSIADFNLSNASCLSVVLRSTP